MVRHSTISGATRILTLESAEIMEMREEYEKLLLQFETQDGFFDYLGGINCFDVEVYAIAEGSVVFPKVPLMRIKGHVAVVQLLETPFVNLINFASLVTTNAARHCFVAGKNKLLLEFGLRRAQGPDGGVGASRYCYMGGFDATSNCAAGKLSGIPLRGTHSHAFVSLFTRAKLEVAAQRNEIADSIISRLSEEKEEIAM